MFLMNMLGHTDDYILCRPGGNHCVPPTLFRGRLSHVSCLALFSFFSVFSALRTHCTKCCCAYTWLPTLFLIRLLRLVRLGIFAHSTKCLRVASWFFSAVQKASLKVFFSIHAEHSTGKFSENLFLFFQNIFLETTLFSTSFRTTDFLLS